MIGQLSGTLIGKQPPRLLLEVNGVGYEVEAPMSTFYTLPPVGQSVRLLIHTHVREDVLQLFGFSAESERELFRALIRVSGVGVRLALAILSGIEPAAFVRCVQAEDSKALTRLPGVGRKTAERLIIEMRDKLKETGVSPDNLSAPGAAGGGIVEEAVTALIALGYKPPEASRMVRAIEDVDNADSAEVLIRQALKAAVK
jgi:Holliday junction DNA helicase RuvA